jgi:phosphoribosylglycinamide formyltransferase-1
MPEMRGAARDAGDCVFAGMNHLMPERFVSEPISPVSGTVDTARMAIGEPGLAVEFVWRGRTISATAVLRTWHETGRCRHGSPERYVRKHWYEVATASDGMMKLYFDRQPRRGRKGPRWWLFSVCEDGEAL